jgi:putative transposase
MPERLRRLDELLARKPIYFVTACTANRFKLLANPALHHAFRIFAERGANAGAWIGAYILMPDHLHLFVVVDSERITLSTWMKALKGAVSSELRRMGGTAPLWQKGFFDHVLRSGESYSAKWNYVRQNATRAGLAPSWEQWPYLGEIFDLEFRCD